MGCLCGSYLVYIFIQQDSYIVWSFPTEFPKAFFLYILYNNSVFLLTFLWFYNTPKAIRLLLLHPYLISEFVDLSERFFAMFIDRRVGRKLNNFFAWYLKGTWYTPYLLCLPYTFYYHYFLRLFSRIVTEEVMDLRRWAIGTLGEV